MNRNHKYTSLFKIVLCTVLLISLLFSPATRYNAVVKATDISGNTNAEINETTGNDLQLEYTIDRWSDGYTIIFDIKNISDITVEKWKLNLLKSDFNIVSAWSVSAQSSGDTITLTPNTWGEKISAGGTKTCGLQGSGSLSDNFTYTLEYCVDGVWYQTGAEIIKSGDASLSRVTVKGVEAVKVSETEYKVTLPFGAALNEVTASDFVLEPTDSKAALSKVSYSGTSGKATVTVTAEDGSKVVYTINVSVPEKKVTDTSYEDGNIKIQIENVRKYDTNIHIADVQLSDSSCLRTALAKDTYGRNITEKTSVMCKRNKGIFAVNGDFYGFRDAGYVVRNGVLYQNIARANGDDSALVIHKTGDFNIIQEHLVNMNSLMSDDIWQVLCFGPTLIENGKILVDSSSEVSIVPFVPGGMAQPTPQAGGFPGMGNMHPRTGIGQISPLHYVFIVSDGRTAQNSGLSLLNLAQMFKEKGCKIAYNLDGGGSSTMYFNGKLVNSPSDGRVTGEREVSDIVYIGY